MAEHDDLWIPLVDEPIGAIVQQIRAEDPEIDRLVDSPRRLLAFRTFAYIRVGIMLGQMLVERDLEPYDGSETWVEALLREPRLHSLVAREVRTVAEEVAADRDLAQEQDAVGPDEEARERFRRFAASTRSP